MVPRVGIQPPNRRMGRLRFRVTTVSHRPSGQRPCYTTLTTAPEYLIPREPKDDFRKVTAPGIDSRWTF